MIAKQLDNKITALLSEIRTIWPDLTRAERKKRRLVARSVATRVSLDKAIACYANDRGLLRKLSELDRLLYGDDPNTKASKRKDRVKKQYEDMTMEGRSRPERKGTQVIAMVSGGGANSTGKRR
jgi:hypothetical protein